MNNKRKRKRKVKLQFPKLPHPKGRPYFWINSWRIISTLIFLPIVLMSPFLFYAGAVNVIDMLGTTSVSAQSGPTPTPEAEIQISFSPEQAEDPPRERGESVQNARTMPIDVEEAGLDAQVQWMETERANHPDELEAWYALQTATAEAWTLFDAAQSAHVFPTAEPTGVPLPEGPYLADQGKVDKSLYELIAELDEREWNKLCQEEGPEACRAWKSIGKCASLSMGGIGSSTVCSGGRGIAVYGPPGATISDVIGELFGHIVGGLISGGNDEDSEERQRREEAERNSDEAQRRADAKRGEETRRILCQGRLRLPSECSNGGNSGNPSEAAIRNEVLDVCFPAAARSLSDEIQALERNRQNSHDKKILFQNTYGRPCCTVNMRGTSYFKCAH